MFPLVDRIFNHLSINFTCTVFFGKSVYCASNLILSLGERPRKTMFVNDS